MPKSPQNPEPDPMIGEVERLLRQLDAVSDKPGTRPPGEAQGARTRPRPGPGGRAATVASPPTFWLPTPRGVWARVALVVVLTVAMTQWPYRSCGWPLVGYMAGLLVLLVAGVWAGYASWRRRMGLAHIASVVLVFAATALAAGQVLPRIGYAAVQMAWRCTP
jgi:hypothetical protein